MKPFKWTKPRLDAARLVADDRLTDKDIAAKVGVSAETLWDWKKEPEFAARVAEHLEAYRDAVMKRGIADRVKRVEALNDRWTRLMQIIEDRSHENPTEGAQYIPGIPKEVAAYGTGLLTKKWVQLGAGKGARLMLEVSVDTGLLKELREHEKQAAQELGQWAERKEITGRDGGDLVVRVVYDDLGLD